MKRIATVTLLLVAGVASSAHAGAPAQAEGEHLYRTLLIRAAPGELATLIDEIRDRFATTRARSAIGPFWMRHSQGDHWDLLLLTPIGASLRDWDPHAVVAGEAESDARFETRILPRIAWREELFVRGPAPTVVAERFAGAGFFHVEIFLALAGRRDELLEQRRMENVYLEGIGRAPNLIFTREAGAAWDSYTLGFYRDLRHFAESADVPPEAEEQAARAAGFEGASTIGTYLRSLIAEHHDTLATAIR